MIHYFLNFCQKLVHSHHISTRSSSVCPSIIKHTRKLAVFELDFKKSLKKYSFFLESKYCFILVTTDVFLFAFRQILLRYSDLHYPWLCLRFWLFYFPIGVIHIMHTHKNRQNQTPSPFHFYAIVHIWLDLSLCVRTFYTSTFHPSPLLINFY